MLRSASLLPAIVARHDAPYIAWLTRKESAELVAMMERVDEVVTLSEDGLARVISGGWHHVYSLSNDLTSASLASAAAARGDPVGFYMRGGIMTPSNEAAARWLEMAAFDRLKRENRQSYQQWMLAILGCPEAAIRAPALRVDEALRAAAA
ncbi:MAG TPA: hypothetical protein VE993_08335, partial [Stellaceae bacterium]|nr:hypothetical protein [Stellaceae bacterium]